MNQEIERLVDAVEAYDFGNGVIHNYHHCRFALPLDKPEDMYSVLILGIAPKERPNDLKLHPARTCETVRYNWRDTVPELQEEQSRWRALATGMCGSDWVIQSEMFFWSTPDLDSEFKARYGSSFLKSPHLEFCRDINLALVDVVNPPIVVVRGLAYHEAFARLYGLKLPRKPHAPGHHVLYERDNRAWLFTHAWTANFTRMHGSQIREGVDRLSKAWLQTPITEILAREQERDCRLESVMSKL